MNSVEYFPSDAVQVNAVQPYYHGAEIVMWKPLKQDRKKQIWGKQGEPTRQTGEMRHKPKFSRKACGMVPFCEGLSWPNINSTSALPLTQAQTVFKLASSESYVIDQKNKNSPSWQKLTKTISEF